jgi:hypothetical protein
MYKWYKRSEVCYAYLYDVDLASDISSGGITKEVRKMIEDSVWFTRGWTLQELIAPAEVVFFSKEWKRIGSKSDPEICQLISNITKIDPDILTGGNLDRCTVAERMSWAANRETTRVEDKSYCLLGIFDVHMPLLYGEGTKAFIRLQEEILKSTEDQSLFAWSREAHWEHYMKGMYPSDLNLSSLNVPLEGLLAESPADFKHSGDVRWRWEYWPERATSLPVVRRNNSIRIQFPLVTLPTGTQFLILPYGTIERRHHYIGIGGRHWSQRYWGRFPFLTSIPMTELSHIDIPKSLHLLDIAPESTALGEGTVGDGDIHFTIKGDQELTVNSVVYPKSVIFDSRLRSIKPKLTACTSLAIWSFGRNEGSISVFFTRKAPAKAEKKEDSITCRVLSAEEVNHLRLLFENTDHSGTVYRSLGATEFDERFSATVPNFQDVEQMLTVGLDEKRRLCITGQRHQLHRSMKASYHSILIWVEKILI